MIGMSRMPITSSVATTRTTGRGQLMSSNTRDKIAETEEPSDHPYSVDFTSILRIRPLSKGKEREDHVVLEKSQTQHKTVAVAVLHPNVLNLTSPEANKGRGAVSSASPNFIHDGKETDFHFHKILDTTASQESVFYAMGLSVASDAMEPLKKNDVKIKSAVLLAIGNGESGKTHTMFGKVSKNGPNDQDGLVPRVLDTLFSQSRHHVSSSLTFGVRLTVLLVEKSGIVRDLLVEQHQATSSNRNGVRALVASFEKTDETDEGEKGGVTISQDPLSNDFHTEGATSQVCLSSTQARGLLVLALQRSQTSRLTSFGKANSRGHVMVTLQPVLLTRTRATERYGGTICVVDISSKDKGKKISRSGQTKDTISGDSTFAALMHCFRTIIYNKNLAEGCSDAIDVLCADDISIDGSEISCVSEPKADDHRLHSKPVPWRQSKVTMLLQPVFSRNVHTFHDRQHQASQLTPTGGSTKVLLVLNAYPGHRDYAEKLSMLNHMEILQGHELSRKIVRRVETGLPVGLGRRQPTAIVEKSSEEMNVGLSYSHSDDDDFNSCVDALTPSKEKRRISAPVIKPSAPYSDDLEQVSNCGISPMPPPTAPSHQTGHNFQPSAPFLINDFPGVALPEPLPHNLSSSSTGSANKDPPSRDFILAKFAQVGASPAVATVKTPVARARTVFSPIAHGPKNPSSNIQTNLSEKEVNTKASLMHCKPVKKTTNIAVAETIENRVYHEETKTQTRVPDVASNLSITRRPNPMVSGVCTRNDEIQRKLESRLKELEVQNERLVVRNIKLENRCEQLEGEKVRWETQLREVHRQGRQREWTQQDEEAWRHSRKLRLAQQDLIQEPLQHHLSRVEETYQINHKWLDSGKEHFALGYPKWWIGASTLNKRDKELNAAERNGTLSPARLVHHAEFCREKRKDKLPERKVKGDPSKRRKSGSK